MAEKGDVGRKLPEPLATLQRLMADPGFSTAYADWVANPVTQRMLALTKMCYGPTGLPAGARTPENALYYSGGVDKLEEVLRFMSDLHGTVDAAVAVNESRGQLTADYGAGKLLASGERA